MKSFEDSWKENRHVFESTRNLAKAMYLDGQQSKQAEVDELRKEFDDFKLRAHHISVQRLDIEAFYDYEKNRANRLQKRIDEALIELEALSLVRTVNSNNAIKILKGNKDETGLN